MLRQALLALLVPAAVVSCGGGGGEETATVLPSTPAILTSVNAPTFGTAVDLATRMAATLHLGPTLSTTVTGALQDGGCFSLGSSPAAVMVSPSTGTVSGTVAYSNFDQCFGLTLAGSASVTGTLNATLIDRLNFTFSNLSFTGAGQAYPMSGSASLQWNIGAGGSANFVMTLNASVSGSRSFRLENFRVDADLAAGILNVLVSGRLATTEGFVDITPTATRIDLPISATGLQNGSVQLTGATTIATVFFNGGGVPPSVISIVPK